MPSREEMIEQVELYMKFTREDRASLVRMVREHARRYVETYHGKGLSSMAFALAEPLRVERIDDMPPMGFPYAQMLVQLPPHLPADENLVLVAEKVIGDMILAQYQQWEADRHERAILALEAMDR